MSGYCKTLSKMSSLVSSLDLPPNALLVTADEINANINTDDIDLDVFPDIITTIDNIHYGKKERFVRKKTGYLMQGGKHSRQH